MCFYANLFSIGSLYLAVISIYNIISSINMKQLPEISIYYFSIKCIMDEKQWNPVRNWKFCTQECFCDIHSLCMQSYVEYEYYLVRLNNYLIVVHFVYSFPSDNGQASYQENT